MPRILLDYPGIKGESLIRNYKNLAECVSFDLSSGKREIGGFNYDDPIEENSYFGSRKAQKQDKLGVDSLKLERHFDLASPKLMQAAFDPQKKDVTATIHFFRTFAQLQGGEHFGQSDIFAEPYLTITLKNTQITEYELSIDNDDSSNGTETIALAFDQLQMTYQHQIDGRKIGQIRGDITLASKS